MDAARAETPAAFLLLLLGARTSRPPPLAASKIRAIAGVQTGRPRSQQIQASAFHQREMCEKLWR